MPTAPAEKLRTGTLGRGVYKDAKRFTALRAKARAYGMVTRDVVRVKSRIELGSSDIAKNEARSSYAPERRHLPHSKAFFDGS